MPDEERLTGGHTTDVVRVGGTVRRPVGRWTPAVHDLLAHLEAAGFTGSPRVRGVDETGREVLLFEPGEVGTLTAAEPLRPWFRRPEACSAIGRWIRDFQTAQDGFTPDPAKPWRRAPGTALRAGEVIVHHDVSPYNTVRRPDGSLVVVDWDFARDEDLSARRRANLAALLDGYGASAVQRARLADAIEQQMTGHAADLEELALTDPAFAALVERDYARAARADAAWWATAPERALLAG